MVQIGAHLDLQQKISGGYQHIISHATRAYRNSHNDNIDYDHTAYNTRIVNKGFNDVELGNVQMIKSNQVRDYNEALEQHLGDYVKHINKRNKANHRRTWDSVQEYAQNIKVGRKKATMKADIYCVADFGSSDEIQKLRSEMYDDWIDKHPNGSADEFDDHFKTAVNDGLVRYVKSFRARHKYLTMTDAVTNIDEDKNVVGAPHVHYRLLATGYSKYKTNDKGQTVPADNARPTISFGNALAGEYPEIKTYKERLSAFDHEEADALVRYVGKALNKEFGRKRKWQRAEDKGYDKASMIDDMSVYKDLKSKGIDPHKVVNKIQSTVNDKLEKAGASQPYALKNVELKKENKKLRQRNKKLQDDYDALKRQYSRNVEENEAENDAKPRQNDTSRKVDDANMAEKINELEQQNRQLAKMLMLKSDSHIDLSTLKSDQLDTMADYMLHNPGASVDQAFIDMTQKSATTHTNPATEPASTTAQHTDSVKNESKKAKKTQRIAQSGASMAQALHASRTSDAAGQILDSAIPDDSVDSMSEFIDKLKEYMLNALAEAKEILKIRLEKLKGTPDKSTQPIDVTYKDNKDRIIQEQFDPRKARQQWTDNQRQRNDSFDSDMQSSDAYQDNQYKLRHDEELTWGDIWQEHKEYRKTHPSLIRRVADKTVEVAKKTAKKVNDTAKKAAKQVMDDVHESDDARFERIIDKHKDIMTVEGSLYDPAVHDAWVHFDVSNLKKNGKRDTLDAHDAHRYMKNTFGSYKVYEAAKKRQQHLRDVEDLIADNHDDINHYKRDDYKDDPLMLEALDRFHNVYDDDIEQFDVAYNEKDHLLAKDFVNEAKNDVAAAQQAATKQQQQEVAEEHEDEDDKIYEKVLNDDGMPDNEKPQVPQAPKTTDEDQLKYIAESKQHKLKQAFNKAGYKDTEIEYQMLRDMNAISSYDQAIADSLSTGARVRYAHKMRIDDPNHYGQTMKNPYYCGPLMSLRRGRFLQYVENVNYGDPDKTVQAYINMYDPNKTGKFHRNTQMPDDYLPAYTIPRSDNESYEQAWSDGHNKFQQVQQQKQHTKPRTKKRSKKRSASDDLER